MLHLEEQRPSVQGQGQVLHLEEQGPSVQGQGQVLPTTTRTYTSCTLVREVYTQEKDLDLT